MESLAGELERISAYKGFGLAGDFNLPGINWNTLAISGTQDGDSARSLLDSAFFFFMALNKYSLSPPG